MSWPDLTIDILAATAARIEENNKRKSIDLQELMKITKFTKQEIRMLYRGFKQVGHIPKYKRRKRRSKKLESAKHSQIRILVKKQRFILFIIPGVPEWICQ